MIRWRRWLVLAFALAGAASAQNVKITPLGSHAGELCDRDRATIFEDPTGVRILYDAGASVTGAEDTRLGTVHVVLLSHAHGDHMHSAAYAVNEFVRPAAVVASHPNEAATLDGKVRPGSRMAAFVAGVKDRPVHMALSGRTMEFDGAAKCVAGC